MQRWAPLPLLLRALVVEWLVRLECVDIAEQKEKTVSTDVEVRQALLRRIKARRASINAFVRDLEPRGARLTTLSLVCSSVATALTAGPALGGARLTDGAANLLNLSDNSLVWRILCLAAMIASIVAAITTNMYKSRDVATRLAKAEASNAKLEGLEVLMEFGQLPTNEAVNLYQQYIAEVPFIHEQLATSA